LHRRPAVSCFIHFLKKDFMLILQNLAYTHANKDLLFDKLNFSLNTYDKVALVGNNGSGKSSLLKLMAGLAEPAEGTIQRSATPYYVPQLFGQYNHLTIAQALGLEDQLSALAEILDGRATEENLTILNDNWTIEERCHEALTYWGLENLDLTQAMSSLSGGQKTKVFLAGITIHQPELILLDEPSNHLDMAGREQLYEWIRHSHATLLVVSHDRTLLNLLDTVYELSEQGIKAYGGNYDFYAEQKQLENNARQEDILSMEKSLRKAKDVQRDTAERRQRLDARGKKKQEKAGVPTIAMNTLRNQAEKSTAKLKSVHAEKMGTMTQELNELRKSLPDAEQMRFGFADSDLHQGKILINAKKINDCYDSDPLWKESLSFQILSGERIAIKGANGSGKSTLIKLILGEREPASGSMQRAGHKAVYIDQEYSLIHRQLTVYEQAQQFNHTGLQEHEVKLRLARFLFQPGDWDKVCSVLSGGEHMRLVLCCLTIGERAPDMIVLDEPTNNLDLQNLEILTAAINSYKGTLLVVSHDDYFLKDVGVEKEMVLG
jgi:ATPase subunit of ABC transporter with duplicated ATPase domains